MFEEFPSENDQQQYDVPWIKCRLNDVLRLQKDLGNRIAKCKRRDDERGIATVPAYEESHIMAEIDPIVVEARENEKRTELIVNSLLVELESKNWTESKLQSPNFSPFNQNASEKTTNRSTHYCINC